MLCIFLVKMIKCDSLTEESVLLNNELWLLYASLLFEPILWDFGEVCVMAEVVVQALDLVSQVGLQGNTTFGIFTAISTFFFWLHISFTSIKGWTLAPTGSSNVGLHIHLLHFQHVILCYIITLIVTPAWVHRLQCGRTCRVSIAYSCLLCPREGIPFHFEGSGWN